jgi:hypothetical protein
MNRSGFPQRFSAALAVFLLVPAAVRAGAIARASLSVTLQYPDVITNVFGFSGPATSFPDPVIDEIPDGVVNKAVPAAISKVQQSPLVYVVTAGPGDAETISDGDATATIEGSVFGNLENLTASPLTVTFSFNIDRTLFTHVDMEGPDFAESRVEASFNFGGVTNDFKAGSQDGDLTAVTGLANGNLAVTIPAASVVPYRLDLYLLVDASSECNDSTCGGTETPEPGTALLLFPSVAALLRKAVCRKKGTSAARS